jgi:GTP-binding protein
MLRIVDSQYIKSAVYPVDFPETAFKEIAFAGKSNVGKSSMINSLTKRKLLAKTSSTPGKTRLVNFFDIRCKYKMTDVSEEMDLPFTLVDLPGYGYAKVSKTERESWQTMIENYLKKREQLAGLVLLVDIRHKADPKDIAMIEFAKTLNIAFTIVATKSDKVPITKIPSYLKTLRTELKVKTDQIRAFSSLSKKGTEELYQWLESVLMIQHTSGRIIIHE